MASKIKACYWKFFGDEAAPTTDDNRSSELSILIDATWQLQLETQSQEDGSSSTIIIDEVTRPLRETVYQIPPHVLALPTLRKDFVLHVLKRLNLNVTIYADLGSQLESFALQLSETYGVNDFYMVVAVKVTRASVVSLEEQVRVLEQMGLVTKTEDE